MAELEQQMRGRVEIAPMEMDLPVRTVLQATAMYFGVEIEAMLGEMRTRDLVRARHVCWWLLRNETVLSYPQIGEIFDRDHTTIVKGVQSVGDKRPLMRHAENITRNLRRNEAENREATETENESE